MKRKRQTYIGDFTTQITRTRTDAGPALTQPSQQTEAMVTTQRKRIYRKKRRTYRRRARGITRIGNAGKDVYSCIVRTSLNGADDLVTAATAATTRLFTLDLNMQTILGKSSWFEKINDTFGTCRIKWVRLRIRFTNDEAVNSTVKAGYYQIPSDTYPSDLLLTDTFWDNPSVKPYMIASDGTEKTIYINGTMLDEAYSAGFASGYKQSGVHWKWFSSDYIPKLNYGKLYLNSNAVDIKAQANAMLIIVEAGMDFACPFIATV